MPTSASSRRPAYTIRPRRASSSPSPSTKAPSITSAQSTWFRTCKAIDPATLRDKLKLHSGDVYNADLVEKSVEGDDDRSGQARLCFCQRAAARRSQFHRPRRSIWSFVVEEGARAYIERINIHGNTRTRDYVIRREFDIGEGDAYNRALIDRAERRLKNLNYLQDRQDHHRAGLGARSRGGQRQCRGKADRRVLGFRRLFHRRRLHRGSQHRRPQPHGSRPISPKRR